MIPEEVENRIARYFFHRYLPDEVMAEVEEELIQACVWTEEEDLDHDELVRSAIAIIETHLEDDNFI